MSLPKKVYVYIDEHGYLIASYELPEDVADITIGRYELETRLRFRSQLQEKKSRQWKDVT